MRKVCVLTASMARDHRKKPGCLTHPHFTRSKVNLAVARGEMAWIDENTAELIETPEAFLARYTRRPDSQPHLMDLEKVVNSTPIDCTARLVSEQSQSIALQ
jgi:hypothetical protein